jgi:hypothetical protein
MKLNDLFSPAVQKGVAVNPKEGEKRRGNEGAKNFGSLFRGKVIDFVNRTVFHSLKRKLTKALQNFLNPNIGE